MVKRWRMLEDMLIELADTQRMEKLLRKRTNLKT